MMQPQNSLLLCGQVLRTPVYSHQCHQEQFLTFPLSVERLSQTCDTINVIARDEQLAALDIRSGDFLSVSGELRSFNNKSGIGRRLIISAYAKRIQRNAPSFCNEVLLSGVLCKAPTYRQTPLGREICDLMLAINRRYGRSDYLPCIAWGRNAYRARDLTVGTPVTISGRIQSRAYIKLLNGTECPRVTYEVSVSSIEAV